MGASCLLGITQCQAVLCLLILAAVNVSCQTAIPPSGSVRPLYACSMQVSDLPMFAGRPTPEMLAGNIGISMGLQGLLSKDPTASCAGLWEGSPEGVRAPQQQVSNPEAADADEPSSSRHGRRQQRPERSAPVIAGHFTSSAPSQAARSSPAARQFGPTTAATAGGGSVAQAHAVNAQASHTSAVATAAAAAAGTVTQAANSSQLLMKQQGNGSHSGSNTSSVSPTVPNAAAAADTVNSNIPKNSNRGSSPVSHNQSTHQPLHTQQQPQQPAAGATRRLLAEESADSSEDSDPWLLSLMSDAGDADADEEEAMEQKQYCGKGSWTASLSSSPFNVPSTAFMQGNVSLITAAATGGSSSSMPTAGNASVSISGHKLHRPGKGLPSKPVKADAADHAHDQKKRRRRTGFRPVWGDDGLWMSESGTLPADASIAAGPHHVMHAVNSLLKIITVDPNQGIPDIDNRYASMEPVVIALPDFFGLVASTCDGGYITPSVAFDKQLQRFLVTAICGGDANQVLLGVSQTWDATGAWWLYAFPAYATFNTSMACRDGDRHYNPTSIHSQVSYNRDGVYISFVQNCPLCNVSKATGAVLYALPKWSLYSGVTSAVVGPVYTGLDVLDAARQYNSEFEGSFRQMQPVLPQRPVDVQADVAYFVNDPISTTNPMQRTQLTAAALLNTGSLWQYSGEDDPAPVLVARVTGRGADCSISNSTLLLQPRDKVLESALDEPPGMCTGLEAGAARPPGFWSGGAALFANQIYLVDRGPDLWYDTGKPYDDSSLAFPTVYWAVLSPSLCASGTCAAFLGEDWAYDEDWSWDTLSWKEPGLSKKQQHTFFELYPQKKRSKGKVDKQNPLSLYLNSKVGRNLLHEPFEAAAGQLHGAAAARSSRASTAGATRTLAASMGTSDMQHTPRVLLQRKPGDVSYPEHQPMQHSRQVLSNDGAGSPDVATASISSSHSNASKAAAVNRPTAVQGEAVRRVATRATPGARRSPFLPPAPKRRGHKQPSAGGVGDDEYDSYVDASSPYDDEDEFSRLAQDAYDGTTYRKEDSRSDEMPGPAAPTPAPTQLHNAYAAPQLHQVMPDPPVRQAQPSHQTSPTSDKMSIPTPPLTDHSTEPALTVSRSTVMQQHGKKFSPVVSKITQHGGVEEVEVIDWREWTMTPVKNQPKPFNSSGTVGQKSDQRSEESDADAPRTDYPYSPDEHTAPEEHRNKGGKAFEWRHKFPALKEPGKKTVWELMLQACHKHGSPVPHSHEEYYNVWREYASVRRLYRKLHIEARFNPCKYHRDWYRDTKITFGVLISRRGVIDQVTDCGGNPVGLAFPQVVVREGSALVTYSYSGPFYVPDGNFLAFPGVGYSVIPPGQAMGSAAFNLLQPGEACVYQGHGHHQQHAWGSYSGADVHFPSATAYTAVEFAAHPSYQGTKPSNAGSWIQAFAPAQGGWKGRRQYQSSFSFSPRDNDLQEPYSDPIQPPAGDAEKSYGSDSDDTDRGDNHSYRPDQYRESVEDPSQPDMPPGVGDNAQKSSKYDDTDSMYSTTPQPEDNDEDQQQPEYKTHQPEHQKASGPPDGGSYGHEKHPWMDDHRQHAAPAPSADQHDAYYDDDKYLDDVASGSDGSGSGDESSTRSPYAPAPWVDGDSYYSNSQSPSADYYAGNSYNRVPVHGGFALGPPGTMNGASLSSPDSSAYDRASALGADSKTQLTDMQQMPVGSRQNPSPDPDRPQKTVMLQQFLQQAHLEGQQLKLPAESLQQHTAQLTHQHQVEVTPSVNQMQNAVTLPAVSDSSILSPKSAVATGLSPLQKLLQSLGTQKSGQVQDAGGPSSSLQSTADARGELADGTERAGIVPHRTAVATLPGQSAQLDAASEYYEDDYDVLPDVSVQQDAALAGTQHASPAAADHLMMLMLGGQPNASGLAAAVPASTHPEVVPSLS